MPRLLLGSLDLIIIINIILIIIIILILIIIFVLHGTSRSRNQSECARSIDCSLTGAALFTYYLGILVGRILEVLTKYFWFQVTQDVQL